MSERELNSIQDVVELMNANTKVIEKTLDRLDKEIKELREELDWLKGFF